MSMGDFEYLHPQRVHLFWAVLVTFGVLVSFELRGRQTLSRFISPVMQSRLTHQPSPTQRVARLLMILGVLTLSVFALMRPQTIRTETKTVQRPSADMMVVLDVSRSMLAADVSPNRLERAKADLLDALTVLKGHRVGLVAFSGRASLACPLTSDLNYFRLVLDNTGPHSVQRGGTRIGDAIRRAIRAFPKEGDAPKVILLFTDGDDHESYPEDAAEEARKAGVTLITVGFGSPEGSPIEIADPDTGERSIVKDSAGNVVKPKLNSKLLTEMATKTGGPYIPAGVGVLELKPIIDEHVRPLVRERVEERTEKIAHEQYFYFVAGALLCLLGAAVVTHRSAKEVVA